MLVHVFSVGLSEESQLWLSKVCSAPPELLLDLNPRIELFASADDEFGVEFDEGVTIVATTQGMVDAYDEVTNATSSLVTLDSQDLQRTNEIISQEYRPAWNFPYRPFFTLVQRQPPRKRHTVAWLNSINSVMRQQHFLTLVDPRIDTVEMQAPSYFNFRKFGGHL